MTVKEGASSTEVQGLLHQHRIEKILVVNDNFDLCGMITVKDFDKAESFPDACKDSYGQLRVGASVGTSPDTDDRVAALVFSMTKNWNRNWGGHLAFYDEAGELDAERSGEYRAGTRIGPLGH